MAIRLAIPELRKDGLEQIVLKISYHTDTKVPKFAFTPPDVIRAIRPGNLTKPMWDEYRAGLYDCVAAYWSWQLRAASLRAAATSPRPSTVQVVRYHPIGSPGWAILRQKIRNRMGV
jgi:hypothetical protein